MPDFIVCTYAPVSHAARHEDNEKGMHGFYTTGMGSAGPPELRCKTLINKCCAVVITHMCVDLAPIDAIGSCQGFIFHAGTLVFLVPSQYLFFN